MCVCAHCSSEREKDSVRESEIQKKSVRCLARNGCGQSPSVSFLFAMPFQLLSSLFSLSLSLSISASACYTVYKKHKHINNTLSILNWIYMLCTELWGNLFYEQTIIFYVYVFSATFEFRKLFQLFFGNEYVCVYLLLWLIVKCVYCARFLGHPFGVFFSAVTSSSSFSLEQMYTKQIRFFFLLYRCAFSSLLANANVKLLFLFVVIFWVGFYAPPGKWYKRTFFSFWLLKIHNDNIRCFCVT